MSVEDFDRDIDELADDHKSVAAMLLELLVNYLRGVLGIVEAEDGIESGADALRQAQRAWIDEVVPDIYADGVRTGASELGVPFAQAEMPDLSSLHDSALALLVSDLSQELAQTTDRMSDDAKRSLREIGRRQVTSMIATGTPSLLQADEFEREMRDRGVAFVDRGGRRWDAGEYARMVLRTHASIIHNEAMLNAAAEMNSPAVKVRDGGPGDVDEPCRRANGQVWSREYAATHLLEHPNCRRVFTPLPPTYSGKIDRR